jgi:hypothetical protein
MSKAKAPQLSHGEIEFFPPFEHGKLLLILNEEGTIQSAHIYLENLTDWFEYPLEKMQLQTSVAFSNLQDMAYEFIQDRNFAFANEGHESLVDDWKDQMGRVFG